MASECRILVVDDEQDLRKHLADIVRNAFADDSSRSLFSRMKSRLSGLVSPSAKETGAKTSCVVDCASQGKEALEMVKAALERGEPYSLIFLDQRMPPGWDGVETMAHIWESDSDAQIILCTAYDDSAWREIVEKKACQANLLLLKKPFAVAEATQMALVLVNKYEHLQKSRMTEAERLMASSVFEALPSMLVLASPDGIVRKWNAAMASFSRRSSEDACGKLLWDEAPFLKDCRKDFETVLQTGQSKNLRAELFAGGEDKHLDIVITPLSSGDLHGAIFRVDDVSVAVKKDEHLRQAQKMDSVGNLAAGLAHDFKNIIGGVTGTSSSIRYSLDTEKDPAKLRRDVGNDLEVIEEAANQGTELVKQLLALSKKQEQPFASVDLKEIVGKVMKICENTLPRCVEKGASLPESPAMVTAYPTQIEQVLLNLCINASHSMTIMRGEGEAEKGGLLAVGVEQISVGRNLAETIPDAHEGNYWMLSVSDTGIGMSKDTIDKIFEPFFTTKQQGVGSGLGLSMVYSIVRQHKGFLEVFSEPGVGSTFFVFLPALETESAST